MSHYGINTTILDNIHTCVLVFLSLKEIVGIYVLKKVALQNNAVLVFLILCIKRMLVLALLTQKNFVKA